MRQLRPRSSTVAAVGGGEAFADFDGGGLAGAVGPEEAEAFAARDFEIDAIHGYDIGERLADSAQ